LKQQILLLLLRMLGSGGQQTKFGRLAEAGLLREADGGQRLGAEDGGLLWLKSARLS
jgi:hypothetical protein